MSAAKPAPGSDRGLPRLVSEPRIKLAPDGRIIHVPVKLRSVIERLNRRLAKQQQTLRKATGKSELGPYYIVQGKNGVVASGIDEKALDLMARQHGVLHGWEKMTQ
jgi:hypothetical protein